MLRLFLTLTMLTLGACAARTAPPPQAVVPVPPSASIFSNPAVTPPAAMGVASCSARPDPAFAAQVPAGALDRALLDRAILFHTNRARCAAGLSPLGPDTGLRVVATGHSADMVRLGFFGHTSPVPGKATVSERLKQRGVTFRGAAENLATASRLDILSGQPVYPLGQQNCAFGLSPRGPRLPIRTYDALAQNLVTRWIESPGHRRNLMDPSYTRHGASGVLDATDGLCGQVNATQLFAG